MMLITRRAVPASGGTVAATHAARKPIARRWLLATGGLLAVAVASRHSQAEFAPEPHRRGLPDLARVLTPMDPPVAPPEGVFVDANGAAHTLESFRGRGMVVNFWATWCQPCVAEIPSLAALSRALAPHDIAVLPLSSDRGGAAIVTSWFAAHEVTGLPVLLDPRGALGQAWGGKGIPTTHIIARDGKETARLEGAADWSSDAAIALIRRLVEV